jgi:hypothetical protein
MILVKSLAVKLVDIPGIGATIAVLAGASTSRASGPTVIRRWRAL